MNMQNYEPEYTDWGDVYTLIRNNGLLELLGDDWGDQLYDFALAVEKHVLDCIERDKAENEVNLDMLIERAVRKE